MSNRLVRILALVVVGALIGVGLLKSNAPKAPEMPAMGGDAQPVAEAPAADAAVNTAATGEATAAPAVDTVATAPGVTGQFSLTDHNGQKVTNASYAGMHKLVFFGFTNCPDICPTTLQKIATVMTNLGVSADKVQPIFITVDPARDTADVMKSYVSPIHPKLVGLTGTDEEVKAAIDAFKTYASKSENAEKPAEYMMDHSSFVYFMDQNDQLIAPFSSDDTADAMTAKIKAAVEGGAVTPSVVTPETVVPTTEGAAVPSMDSATDAVTGAMDKASDAMANPSVENIGASVEAAGEAKAGVMDAVKSMEGVAGDAMKAVEGSATDAATGVAGAAVEGGSVTETVIDAATDSAKDAAAGAVEGSVDDVVAPAIEGLPPMPGAEAAPAQ